MKTINVMLVDDQPLILEGIKTLLSIDDEIDVVAKVKCSEEALGYLEENQVDVILMDIRMPGMGGVEGTRRILDKYPNIVIIILTTFDDDNYIIDALRYGAKGYLLKDIEPAKLVESIHEAISGNLLLTGNVAKKLAFSAIEQSQKKLARQQLIDSIDLTQREIDIAALMIEGLSSKEISEKLFLTQGTIKNYFSSIYSKVGTNDRAKALLLLSQFLDK